MSQLSDDKMGGDVAHLVEHWTGTPLRQVRFPGAARDFSLRVSLSVQTLPWCPYAPVCKSCTNICAHVQDPVVHVTVRWIMGALKHPACTIVFPGESTPNFPWEKSQ